MPLTTGSLKTRSAPSGRRKRPVRSWMRGHRHQPVHRDGAGVVGDDQGAALGRDVLDAADLDAEPLLRDRAERGDQEALGDLGVEAVLVDDVVAGDATAQEREELREPGLPVVAEDLAGGVGQRGQPVGDRDAGGALGGAGGRGAGGRGSRRRPPVAGLVGAGLDRVGSGGAGLDRGPLCAAGRPSCAAGPARLRAADDGLPGPCRGRGGRGCRSG